MTSLKTTLATSRRAARNGRSALAAVTQGEELMQAAADVVSARLRIMADGVADPARADLKEMALMGMEKMEAAAASSAALGRGALTVSDRLSRGASREMTLASTALAALTRSRTPIEAASIQMSYVLGWWGRAAAEATAVSSDLLKSQADAVKPLHRAAVANARRLRK